VRGVLTGAARPGRGERSLAAVVGVDLGTTDTKALVVGLDGVELGFARRHTTWTHRPGGQAETTGRALLGDLLDAVGDALAGVEERVGVPVRVLGIGLAGLGESGVLLDAAGSELTPVIAWFDPRGAAELRRVDAGFAGEFPRHTGLALGTQCTLAKLLWMRGAGLALPPGGRWLNMPEYLAHALGGERVSEPSLASRTGLLDQGTAAPWSPALDLLGLADGVIPELVPAGRAVGRVSLPGAPPGLSGAVITVAGHDHAVASVGAGATGPDMLFNSCGTADVLLRAVSRPLTDDERGTLVANRFSAGRHVLPERSALLGSVRGGLVLRRVLGVLGANEPAGRDRLDQAWDGRISGAVTVSGGRIDADQITIALGDGATPDDLWAAAIEHVTQETAGLLAALHAVTGPQSGALAAGGWTRMRSVRAAKSRILPGLAFSPVSQPGALGAATFAGWAAAGNPGTFLDFAAPVLAAGRQYDEPSVHQIREYTA
jgi:sugar (pentulose or hexulose) kinase